MICGQSYKVSVNNQQKYFIFLYITGRLCAFEDNFDYLSQIRGAKRQRQNELSCLAARNLNPSGEIFNPSGKSQLRKYFQKKRFPAKAKRFPASAAKISREATKTR
ncbi:MAG: hypothetical protein KBT39_11890 [Bacteroidales bacterium]|nr:hypothetical protein [Bacteroidales bacterium]